MGKIAHLSTVEVMINNSGPYSFVLDTGAGINVLNEKLAETLKLSVVGSVELGSPMGDKPSLSDQHSLGSLAIGDVVFEDVLVVSMDLDGPFRGLKAPDGILAAAALEGHVITINYPQDYMTLQKGTLPPADGLKILEYDGTNTVPHLEVSVGGKTVEVALDSGAPHGISLPMNLSDELPLEGSPKVVGRGRTVDAEFEILSSKLVGDFQLGEMKLANPNINFNRKAPYGNIGIQILGDYSVAIDCSNQRISFSPEPGAKVAEGKAGGPKRMVRKRSGKQSYGIQLTGIVGDELEVLGTSAGLPAEIAGLLVGDKIKAMNGKQLKSISGEERVKALRGSPLVLLVDRNGEEVELTLGFDK
ncbi:MAG: hypothetical protein GY780_18975 [bacterium]|nr:hypothetical protein [bacterium]